MKSTRLFLVLFGASMLLFSCAPVLDRSLMKEAARDVSFRALRERPDEFKGRLFVLGGVIVRARLTAEGSQIEALHVPVDSSGYFNDQGRSEGRYLAVLPKDDEILDPEIYRQGRRVTLAGRFIGLHKEKIEEMEYVFPVFRIEQIYLWPKDTYYAPGYYGYYYDPGMYPYPYYYWDLWWGYPYYPYYYPDYYPYYYRGYPPAYGYPYQRVPSPERTPAPQRAPAPAPAPAPQRR